MSDLFVLRDLSREDMEMLYLGLSHLPGNKWSAAKVLRCKVAAALVQQIAEEERE